MTIPRNRIPPRPGTLGADNLPFRVEFFHPATCTRSDSCQRVYDYTVQPIRFVQDFFNYRGLHIEKQSLRTLVTLDLDPLSLNAPDRWDELGAFLRQLFPPARQDQRYGCLLAGSRWIAANLAGRKNFPFHRLVARKPHRGMKNCVSLQSLTPSVVLAPTRSIQPGETTVVDVKPCSIPW